MARTVDALSPRGALVEVARLFYQRGWMVGTAGNLSARAAPQHADDRGSYWITASSLPKGQLEESDFLRVDLASGDVVERSHGNLEPSAESSIHATVYRLFADANACLHVHSIDGCLAAARSNNNATELPLPPLEMVKGLGVWDENPKVALPVFPNHGDVRRIALEIDWRFARDLPKLPALMIRDHGVTVWGRTIQDAVNRLECMEFIFGVMARSR